jgi:cardiolipin synthase
MRNEGRESIWNIPNILTLFRFGMVPLFIFMVLQNRALGALLVFFLASLTDVLDGFAARTWRMRTKIGMLLDPLADKALMVPAFVLLSLKGLNSPYVIPLWLTATVLARDFIIVAGGVVIYRLCGSKEFPPSLFGKISTVCQVGTVFWVLFSNYIQISSWISSPALSFLTSRPVLSVFFYSTLVFTVVSGMQYVLRGIRMTFHPQK